MGKTIKDLPYRVKIDKWGVSNDRQMNLDTPESHCQERMILPSSHVDEVQDFIDSHHVLSVKRVTGWARRDTDYPLHWHLSRLPVIPFCGSINEMPKDELYYPGIVEVLPHGNFKNTGYARYDENDPRAHSKSYVNHFDVQERKVVPVFDEYTIIEYIDHREKREWRAPEKIEPPEGLPGEPVWYKETVGEHEANQAVRRTTRNHLKKATRAYNSGQNVDEALDGHHVYDDKDKRKYVDWRY